MVCQKKEISIVLDSYTTKLKENSIMLDYNL